MNDTSPKDLPAPRELELKMCEIIERLYQIQHEFDTSIPVNQDTMYHFDNAILDCVCVCTNTVTEHIRSRIIK